MGFSPSQSEVAAANAQQQSRGGDSDEDLVSKAIAELLGHAPSVSSESTRDASGESSREASSVGPRDASSEVPRDAPSKPPPGESSREHASEASDSPRHSNSSPPPSSILRTSATTKKPKQRVRFAEPEKPPAFSPTQHYTTTPQNPQTPTELLAFYKSKCAEYCERPLPQILAAFESLLTDTTNPTSLSTLLLTDSPVASTNLNALVDLLRVPALASSLRVLSLRNCSLNDDVLRLLLQCLLAGAANATVGVAGGLDWLDLGANQNIRADGVKSIAVFVKKSKRLRYLDLSEINIDLRSAEYLAQALSFKADDGVTCRVPLEILKLENCRLRTDEIAALAPGIASSRITHLNLRYNKMPFDCTRSLSLLLTLAPPHLTHLDLRGNNFRHSLSTLTATLSHPSMTLTTLNLRENKLSSENLMDVADMLAANTSLKSINLAGNNFFGSTPASAPPHPQTLSALKRCLTASSSLQEISLANTNLGADAAVAVSEAMMADGCLLRRMDLSYNPVERRGVVAVLDAVRVAKGIVLVGVCPILDAKGGVVDDLEILSLDSQIKEQCEQNRHLLIAKRGKRVATPESLALSTDSLTDPTNASSSTFSLLSPPIHYPGLSTQTLDSSESLRSEAIARGENVSPPPLLMNSPAPQRSPRRLISKSVSIDSFSSGNGDEHEHAGLSVSPTASPPLDFPHEDPPFSIVQFEQEVVECEERCCVLSEMLEHVRLVVAEKAAMGEKGGGVDVDREVIQDLYTSLRSFKRTLERTIAEGLLSSEETLCKCLTLNDQIEQTFHVHTTILHVLESLDSAGSSSSTTTTAAAAPPVKPVKQGSTGLTPLETKFKNLEEQAILTAAAAASSSSSTSGTPGNTNPAQLPAFPTETVVTSPTISLTSPMTTTFAQQEPDVFNPVIPASQILYTFEPGSTGPRKPSRAGSMNEAAKKGALLSGGMASAVAEGIGASEGVVPPAPAGTTFKKSFSLSSFEDVVDGDEYMRAAGRGKGGRGGGGSGRGGYLDDSFLAELDSQMKEIDEFLSSSSLEKK
ncbi:hypothetical protein HDU98_011201 [Podochytrium sp. JEL0797]|nr:hypothetical protein HDU98_011201 [Podochytrium sp. JEL0797]